jgi:hypothetical protein
VTPAGSVTNLVSNPAQPTFGQPVTFTATVTPTQGVTPVPTGSVKYFLDGVQVGPIGGVTLDPNGQAGVAVPADFTYTQFQGGDHTIMADYLGDATYDVSGATLNETVLRAITSTSVTGAPSVSHFGQPVTITAVVSGSSPTGTPVDPTAPTPTGLVDFVDTSTGADLGSAPVDGTGHAALMTAGLKGGGHAVRADYLGQPTPVGPGDKNYGPTGPGTGSGSYTQLVNPDATSTFLVTDHPGGAIFGEPVTFTAAVTNTTPGLGSVVPQGQVTFVDLTTGTTLGAKGLDPTGHAKLTVNNVSVGSNTIQALFNANPNFSTSSGATTQSVSPGTVLMSLGTSQSPSTYGEGVIFVAHLIPKAPSTLNPPGVVSFFDVTAGNKLLGMSPIDPNGNSSLGVSNLNVGTHTIRADYNPPPSTYIIVSAQGTQVVGAAATTTAISASDNPAVYDQPITLTAHVSNVGGSITPTGLVVFIVDGLPPAATSLDAAGNASFTTGLALGSHKIQAVYHPSNVGFFASTSPSLAETVNPAQTKTSLFSSTSQAELRQRVTFSAGVSAAPSLATPTTGSVTFRIDGAPVATIGLNGSGRASYGTASLPPGNHSVSATYSPSSPNFLGSATSINQVVRQHYFVVAGAAGAPGIVEVFDPSSGRPVNLLQPFGGGFPGGISVAVGDINGDDVDDLVVADDRGNGSGIVLVYDGRTFAQINAFHANHAGASVTGVSVAVGDMNGDGKAEIITGADGIVTIYDGASQAELTQFAPFPGSTGRVNVAAGDVNGDGRADVIAASDLGSVTNPVFVYNGVNLAPMAEFIPLPGLLGAASVAAGDVNGDGHADLIVVGGVGTFSIGVYSGAALANGNPVLFERFLPHGAVHGGFTVGVTDRNADGRADIIVGTASMASFVVIVDGSTLQYLDAFYFLGSLSFGVNVGGSV